MGLTIFVGRRQRCLPFPELSNAPRYLSKRGTDRITATQIRTGATWTQIEDRLPTVCQRLEHGTEMSKAVRIADSAGTFGAIFAALCCAGAPLILSVLAAVGLSFLVTDAILLPLMGLSLSIALWGFWRDRRLHGRATPLLLAIVASLALVAGVVFVHGSPAKALIGMGAVGLVAATVWNILLRRAYPRALPEATGASLRPL